MTALLRMNNLDSFGFNSEQQELKEHEVDVQYAKGRTCETKTKFLFSIWICCN